MYQEFSFMNESQVQDGSADILIYTYWCTSFLNAYKQTDAYI